MVITTSTTYEVSEIEREVEIQLFRYLYGTGILGTIPVIWEAERGSRTDGTPMLPFPEI
jgi:hypothetical protein